MKSVADTVIMHAFTSALLSLIFRSPHDPMQFHRQNGAISCCSFICLSWTNIRLIEEKIRTGHDFWSRNLLQGRKSVSFTPNLYRFLVWSVRKPSQRWGADFGFLDAEFFVMNELFCSLSVNESLLSVFVSNNILVVPAGDKGKQFTFQCVSSSNHSKARVLYFLDASQSFIYFQFIVFAPPD